MLTGGGVKKVVRAIMVVISAGLFWAAQADASSLEPSQFPSLVSSLNTIGDLRFCQERVPLETQEVRERLEKELLLTIWDRPQVILWLKRSPRYMPHIENMLKKNGMPDDLKYMAIAESALRPHAGSPKGAVGFWQFLKATGRKHGLVVNRHMDERRNVFTSTRAALGYLKELRVRFGSWTLAAAAYNMGEEGLEAEILEQEVNDYYRLYLPLETQRYIFRILSAKLIFSDPEKYGFRLTKDDYYPPLRFDRVEIDCVQDVPIRIIAQAAKTHFKAIKDLNPQIRGHYLVAGNHEILVPKGASAGFEKRFASLLRAFEKDREARVYVVEKGDNLTHIAEKFGVPLEALLIWNRLDLGKPIHPGDRLIIHKGNLHSDKRVKN